MDMPTRYREKPYKIIQEVLFVVMYIFIQKHSICNIGTTITFK
jgi:hypothetical protein